MDGPPADARRHQAHALRARVLSAMAIARPHPEEQGATGVLNRLCRTIVTDLDFMGAAVNLMSDASRGQAVVGRSDQRSAVVDELQFTAGEGPCHDALRTGRPVHSGDLRAETRWLGYCAAAQELDVRSVYAFPLQVGADNLGVLDMYDSRARVLEQSELALALAYADIATESLVHRNGHDEDVVDPGLRTALGSRAQVYQAQGMVMIDQDVTLNEAMVRIRAFAFGNQRSLGEVAHDIVGGTLTLSEATPLL